MMVHMLTTFDNPYSPFDEFDSWYNFDTTHSYGTLAFLARNTNSSPDLSEADQAVAIEQSIDEIVQENVSGMWKKVSKEIPDSSAA